MLQTFQLVTVVGGGQDINLEPAYETGRLLAQAGFVLITGGEGGIMKAASKGAYEHGGLVVGILPGESVHDSPPNPYVHIPIYTGINEARNVVNILSGSCVIAHPGGPGTEQEISLAVGRDKPLITVGWKKENLPASAREKGIITNSPEDAVAQAIECMKHKQPNHELTSIFKNLSPLIIHAAPDIEPSP